MTKLESILQQARSLSPPELEELMKALSAFTDDGGEDDLAVGRRGLAALTESTKDEDWSMYHPDELRYGAKKT